MTDTIFALATGALGCAVAVVRVSGSAAASIADRFCGPGITPRVAAYRKIVDPRDGELIDHGLVLFFQGPASFSGEDCLEFQVHGGRAVVGRLLEALGATPGARMAQPGEFIRRAFDNDKLPLTSIEGIADLIDARTDAQRRQALAQAGGRLAKRADEWRHQLLDCLALIEAEIDFVDEGDAPSGVLDDVRARIASLLAEFKLALTDAQRGERIRNGFRVVIAGPPNAGKSSLLNALAMRDVAIVTEYAGTTRDIIEVELDLNGFPVTFCDTAGIRDAEDAVEAIGIGKSHLAISSADLVIWLSDSGSPTLNLPLLEDLRAPMLIVASQMDRHTGDAPQWADFGISVRSGLGLSDLVSRVQCLGASCLAGEPPLVTNVRQKSCVHAAAEHLSRVLTMEHVHLELLSEDLRLCAREIEILVGQVGSEDVLRAIFSRFCMGK